MTAALSSIQRRRRWFRPLDGVIVLALLTAVALIGIIFMPVVVIARMTWLRRDAFVETAIRVRC